MAAEHPEDEEDRPAVPATPTRSASTVAAQSQAAEQPKKEQSRLEDDGDDEEEEEDDEDEEEEEPKLKYSRLTTSLGGAYRSGDSTSSFVLSGDKMVKTPSCLARDSNANI